MMKLSVLLLALSLTPTFGGAAPAPLRKVDSPDMRRAIVLEVREGIEVGLGKPGFRLSLSGWPKGALFDVYALDADGTRVALVEGAPVDTTGAAEVAVPYEAAGLHPGPWIIGVASGEVSRGEKLVIPKVIHGRRGWRLDFTSLVPP